MQPRKCLHLHLHREHGKTRATGSANTIGPERIPAVCDIVTARDGTPHTWARLLLGHRACTVPLVWATACAPLTSGEAAAHASSPLINAHRFTSGTTRPRGPVRTQPATAARQASSLSSRSGSSGVSAHGLHTCAYCCSDTPPSGHVDTTMRASNSPQSHAVSQNCAPHTSRCR
jgi:hypothetical protein